QQNFNKSNVAQSKTISSVTPDFTNIITIQEPDINFLRKSISSPYWFSVYPKSHYIDSSSTCFLLLLSKHLAMDSWEIIVIECKNLSVHTKQTVPICVLVSASCVVTSKF
ncbi:hypothetical protein K439DRAFT_1532509, partial [Ramaria rubella]